MNLELLEIEVEELEKAASGDFSACVWANWPDYVVRFNTLAGEATSLDASIAAQRFTPVPDGQLLHMVGIGGGSPAEQAKLREIGASCSRLRRLLSVAKKASAPETAITAIAKICARFHSVALSLRARHGQRAPFRMEDEYDVQDLMRALLALTFDDIRPEEWTPSYAGSSKRMDFLLKGENIVLELKKTRAGLGAKEVGDQLIIDIEHYKQHPSCKTLICFIYDPDSHVANPRGLERDLMQQRDQLSVIVYVVPRP